MSKPVRSRTVPAVYECGSADQYEARLREVRTALRMVLGSTLMEADDHDWMTCEQPSCVMARSALGVK